MNIKFEMFDLYAKLSNKKLPLGCKRKSKQYLMNKQMNKRQFYIVFETNTKKNRKLQFFEKSITHLYAPLLEDIAINCINRAF